MILALRRQTEPTGEPFANVERSVPQNPRAPARVHPQAGPQQLAPEGRLGAFSVGSSRCHCLRAAVVPPELPSLYANIGQQMWTFWGSGVMGAFSDPPHGYPTGPCLPILCKERGASALVATFPPLPQ